MLRRQISADHIGRPLRRALADQEETPQTAWTGGDRHTAGKGPESLSDSHLPAACTHVGDPVAAWGSWLRTVRLRPYSLLGFLSPRRSAATPRAQTSRTAGLLTMGRWRAQLCELTVDSRGPDRHHPPPSKHHFSHNRGLLFLPKREPSCLILPGRVS